jgi:hypothetical protein
MGVFEMKAWLITLNCIGIFGIARAQEQATPLPAPPPVPLPDECIDDYQKLCPGVPVKFPFPECFGYPWGDKVSQSCRRALKAASPYPGPMPPTTGGGEDHSAKP